MSRKENMNITLHTESPRFPTMIHCIWASRDFVRINCFKICFNCQNPHDLWQLKYWLFCSKTQMPISFFVSLFKCYDIIVLFTTREACLKRYDFLISEFLKASGPYLGVTFPSGFCRLGSAAEAWLAALCRAPAWWTQLPSNRRTPPLPLHNHSTQFPCGFQINR